ncbi:hypothetical protein [Streptomyces sp. NRRL F-5053]|uniref:hypothetical protein n=1 Tax=Streptomyces sp. NRRL F-5053 TaxID=1463854 RepID=UPI0004CC66E5|nr:hypothetical protein [Streptomyces sp. NRRL F-5053]
MISLPVRARPGIQTPPTARFSLRGVLALNPGPWLWGQALLVAGSGAAVFLCGVWAAGLTAGLAAFVGSWNVMLEQRTPRHTADGSPPSPVSPWSWPPWPGSRSPPCTPPPGR